MSWIDDDKYLGPDRRGGGSGLRIFDRRRHAGARSTPPALSLVIRQLKTASLGLRGAEQWARFRIRVEGAIGIADLQGERACRNELSQLRTALLAATPAAPLRQSVIDAFLERARNGCKSS